MRKWAFILVAAAVALVGCGGTGGTKAAPGNPGGGTTNKGIGVVLTSKSTEPPGAIEVAYLTGQGRAAGDLIAEVKTLVFADNFGQVTNVLAPITDCPLTGFQNNIVHLDVDFATQAPGVPSRQFTSFNMNFYDFLEETSIPGSNITFTTPSSAAEGGPFPKIYPASMRVFPGRVTSLPIYIDDSMFTIDATNPSGPAINYNESQFQLSNGATAASPIKGFLSDYVSFNLNGMSASDKAVIGTAAGFVGQADRIFFSGDVYAVTNGHTSGSNIAALTLNPSLQVNGNLGGAGTLAGPGGTLPHAGTYSLLAVNPTDITQQMKIVAGQGIWREHSTVMKNLSSSKLNVVTFPSSNDDNMQEMVAFTQDANNNIQTIYFGFADLDALTFTLYPAINLVSGTTVDGSGNANGVSGTIGAMYSAGGGTTAAPDLVRSGTYTVTSVPAATAYPQPPASMAKGSTGSFYVFRI
ncbi:MAG: hypothetical protein P4L46_03305 [Fimbriimonas sp.]|nr:hypothetical protein [Fimbriimonas sp.]